MGATGEKLDDSIAGINKFMAESPGEVVILWVWYMVDLNSNIPAGTGRFWSERKTQSFYSGMEGIKNRCIGLSPDVKLDRLPLKRFMDLNNRAGCVLIIADGRLGEGISSDKPDSGIYDRTYMDRADIWSGTPYVDEFALGQIEHMRSKKRTGASNTAEDPFLIMQWLGTQDPLTSTLETSNAIYTLFIANPALYWNAFNAMSPELWPTVIMQDHVGMVVNPDPDAEF
jgi:hypothetical protein